MNNDLILPNKLVNSHPGLSTWSILVGYRGSVAHGMYIPSDDPDSIDDIDLMGVCVPPVDYYFGMKQYGSRGTLEIKDGKWDIVVYEAKKMVHLLAQGNPNVLSLLWLDSPDHYLNITEAGQLLIENRRIFSAAHVYSSFTGYAHSQLKKMESFVFNGYMGDKRRRLVERHGYDTKNAAHLIRLLRMSIEFLDTGSLRVLRQDAEELLEIKRGLWSLPQVKNESNRLFGLAEGAYMRTKLPPRPNMEVVNKLCVNIINMHYETGGGCNCL